MAEGTFRLEGDLVTRLNQFGPKTKRAMVAGANYTATRVESFMKSNAKWTDRTGNARSGLKADVHVSTNTVAIVIYHSVPYGVFLEVRWGGKYAILRPGLEYGAPLFVKTVAKLMFS